jgi:protein-S-isoprenylcysteine O-methyltransferase Ste14
MEKAFAKVEELAATLKVYLNSRIESVKLNAAEKSSQVLSNVLAGLAVAVIFLCCFIFGSLALAFILGDLIGQTWAGFLAVSILHFLLAMLLWILRERILRLPLMNGFINQLFKTHEKD